MAMEAPPQENALAESSLPPASHFFLWPQPHRRSGRTMFNLTGLWVGFAQASARGVLRTGPSTAQGPGGLLRIAKGTASPLALQLVLPHTTSRLPRPQSPPLHTLAPPTGFATPMPAPSRATERPVGRAGGPVLLHIALQTDLLTTPTRRTETSPVLQPPKSLIIFWLTQDAHRAPALLSQAHLPRSTLAAAPKPFSPEAHSAKRNPHV